MPKRTSILTNSTAKRNGRVTSSSMASTVGQLAPVAMAMRGALKPFGSIWRPRAWRSPPTGWPNWGNDGHVWATNEAYASQEFSRYFQD